MLSPLQLKHNAIEFFSIKENAQHPDKSGKNWIPDEPSVEASIAFSASDSYRSKITLKVESQKNQSKDEETYWEFAAHLVGYFEFTNKEYDLTKAKKLTFVNGSAMLYGIAREMLLNISLRGTNPNIFLPSIDFSEFAKGFNQEEGFLTQESSQDLVTSEPAVKSTEPEKKQRVTRKK